MRKGIAVAVMVGAMMFALSAPALAKTEKGLLYLDGEIVGTVVNAGSLPHGGNDPFYAVTNGVEGQLGIAGVGPGDAGYNGGAWAVNTVTFNAGVDPYLLTSDEAVFAAEAAGDVTVTRVPEADFRCPIT
jgi:hypothetical protein